MFKQISHCSALVGPAPRRIALTAAFTIGLTSYLAAQVNFISSQTIPQANACTGLFAGHFNSDAKSDFMASCRPNYPPEQQPRNITLLNNGNGTYAQVDDTVADSTFRTPVLVTDLNGDGISDLILADEGNDGFFTAQLGNPDGTFRAPYQVFSASGASLSFVAGDFSNNGRKDLAFIVYTVTGNGTTTLYHNTLTILLNKGDGTFQQSNSYTLNTTNPGQGLPLLSSGDINGDGKADLAVVYGGANGTVVPYLSSGNGVFVKESSFSAGKNPGSAVIGKLNSDAYGDLAIPTSTGVTTLFGSPSGALTVGPFVTYQNPTGQSGFGSNLLLADVSRDGKTDMVFTSSNLVFVYKGNGDGTFASPAVYSVPSTLALSLADTNGNGNLDLAVIGLLSGRGSDIGSISLLINDGKGSYRAAPNSYSPLATGIVSADFNHDGKRDVAFVNTPSCTAPCNGKVTIFTGTGSTYFNAGTQYTIGMHGMAIATGDLNGDGVTDLVVTNGTPGDNADVSILLGIKTGGFQPSHNLRLGSLSNDAFLVDMNHDGKLDLVEDGGIALGDGEGSFGDLIPYPNGIAFGRNSSNYFTTYLGVGDFNGDGIFDIAAAVNNQVWVLTGDGTGHFTGAQLEDPDQNVQQAVGLIVGKLHGGTISDIVVASYNIDSNGESYGEAVLFKGNGNGTFQDSVGIGVQTGDGLTGAVSIADFNHDGKNDVALSNETDVEVMLGNGDGTFNASGHFAITSATFPTFTGNPVGYVAVADFNGDGLPDMIFTNDHGLSRLYSVPAPSVSPITLAWTPNNDSAVQVVTIKNTLTTAQSIRAVLSDPSQSEYQITSNTCGSSLAAGGTCKVSIKHNGGAGRPSDSLYVSDNGVFIASVSLQAAD
jgi:FG-GAP-like repeat